MSTATPEQIAELSARDLKVAAFHEAGHAIVCRHYGGVASAMIWANDSERIDEKAWLGQCRMFVLPGMARIPAAARAKFGIKRAPKRWPVLVGLAGVVAEYMLDNPCAEGHNLLDCRWDVEAKREWGSMSDTDLDLIGPDVHHRDVAKVLEILSNRWTEVQQQADWLMLDALGTEARL